MRKQLMVGAFCVMVAAVAGSQLAAQNQPPAGGGRRGGGRGGAPVTVEMTNAKGESVGTATLTGGPDGLSIAYDFKNLPPGEHALHIHMNAKCDPPDFMTAGGHFNPDMKKHGLNNPDGPHAGDMPNFTVASDGTAKGTTTDPRVVLGGRGAANSVFANGGTALMIHAAADDMKTDPAGNAGARIACGTVMPPARGGQ